MMKKIIGWMLITVMLVSMIAVSAEAKERIITVELSVGYLTGDTTKIVTKDDLIATDGAAVSGNGVQIDAGGSATFGFSSRFAMRSVTLKFEGASGTTTIDTGDNLYTVTDLAGDGEYTLVFGENLGYKAQPYLYPNQYTGYYREYLELKGEKEVKVSTTGGMYLKEMVFEKDKTPIIGNNKQMGTPNITAQEKAIMTTIALDEMATAILVNGAIRYIDNNDVSTRPYEQDGTLYLPISTLAKALGYYVEDYPERDYALLRSDTHEYVMLEGKQFVITGLSEPAPAPFEAIIRRDGKTLAAVRYFAELMGETVIYDNGLIIIEDKYVANDFVNDESMRAYISSKLAPFKVEDTIGKTYYVAQNGGDDKNPGTSLAPFKTIERAANIAAAGDTVIVRAGTYREILKPANSGKENAPITFKAAEGEQVVISALEEFDTWVKMDDGTYMTKMSWDLGKVRNQLFIDGEPLVEARHPNGPGIVLGESPELDDRLYPVRGDLYRPTGDENRNLVRSSTQLWQEEDYWKGGVFLGLFGYAYQTQGAIIAASKPGELVLGPEKSSYWYIHKEDDYFNWGYIIGHRNALDVPGEWFREDTGLLYLMYPEGKNPQNSKVEAKARQLVIDLNDKRFVNVEGFDTIGGSARMNRSTMCMINGVDMKYISHSMLTADHATGYLDFDYSLGLDKNGDYVRNNNDPNGAPERGEVGVYIEGQNNIFVNSTIKYSGYAGLYMVGLYTYVENNVIADAGYTGTPYGGLLVTNRNYDDVNKAKGGHFIHNNTVYNGGRSPMNIGKTSENKNTPYLPMDIGYNDFHDGSLMSTDTGQVYQYDINAGYDGVMTKEHHNYVYLTTGYKDWNPHSNMIYHDGSSYGVDSFKNHVFWTNDAGISGEPFQAQYAKHAPANFLQWDNYIPGILLGGVDTLDAQYFVEDRPYYAGCLQNVDYTKNYDKFKSGSYGMQFTAADAELSEGVTVDETGYAHFTESGQYIKFNDVDFGEAGNYITLSTRGNYTHTYDVVEIIIGDSLESEHCYELTIENFAPEADIPSRSYQLLQDMKGGVHDVYIRVKDYYSLEIGGFSVHEYDVNPYDDLYSCHFSPGEFQEVVKFDPKAVSTPPERMPNLALRPTAVGMASTFPGWYVKYENLEFTTDTDAFVSTWGSGVTYAYQPIEIYIDGLEPENMVCKLRSRAEGWDDRTLYMDELNRTVKAGIHDVYFKFPADEGYSKSSNAFTTAFLKKGVLPERVNQPKVKVYGGKFDAALSVQNTEYPFYTELMNPPNFYAKGVTYTLPGTVAGYKEINIPFDATKLVVNYASEPGVDGQPVEVRLGSPDSEPIASFVTEGKGMLTFNKLEIELDETIPAGKYDVYFSFGGDKNAKLNTKIDWFGFND